MRIRYHINNKQYIRINNVVVVSKGANMDSKTHRRLATEVEILKRVSHPHIIPLKDILDTPEKLYLVMEL